MMEEVKPVEEAVSTETVLEVDPLNTPEVNRAARDFNQLTPRIRGFAKNMNGKGLARVLIAITEFPLAPEYPKFKNQAERELFMMCLHAGAAKQVMTDVIVKNTETLKEIQQEAMTSIVDELKQKESENV
jgi:hypothetical protein